MIVFFPFCHTCRVLTESYISQFIQRRLSLYHASISISTRFLISSPDLKEINIDSLLHVPREKKNLPCKTHHKFKNDSQLEFVKIKQSLKEERNEGPTFHKPSIVRMRRSASASISAFITSGSDLRWVSRFLSPKARETVSWPFTLATSPEI